MNEQTACRDPMNRPLSSAVLLALLLLWIGGCSTTPVAPSTDEPSAPTGTGAPATAPAGQPSAEAARPSTDGATLALLQQSDRAVETGNLDEALAYVERAVRIEPRRADLWTRLASLEVSAGNPSRAIQYAQKALSLAPDRPDWQRDAWLVIADARDALGEHETAKAIRQRWQTARG